MSKKKTTLMHLSRKRGEKIPFNPDCADCQRELAAELKRPSNRALMTRSIQICEQLSHIYNASHVRFVYEQLQHVRRYAQGEVAR